MTKKTSAVNHWLQTTAVRNARVHFIFIIAYILTIIVFDSWNLYTHQAASQLWTAGGVLLIANTIIWYLSRLNFSKTSYYVGLILLLVLADIAFASYNVYWQHGLASKAVMLFAVPIITAATLRSRSTLLAATTLSAAAYSIASVRYFFTNYGLSYRVELWGTVGFYSALFFVLALLLMVIISP
ncbi:hypothetical protein KW789_01440, partial [Candidatus Saccharibacteria bacterium]|nr:hypothetical protein [Candidatus Saccharibacteria bacterium]